jgi:hypothetical protein
LPLIYQTKPQTIKSQWHSHFSFDQNQSLYGSYKSG